MYQRLIRDTNIKFVLNDCDISKDEFVNRAIKVYIKKLEDENNLSKQIFSEINDVVGFDGSRPNRTNEDKYSEILGILKYYNLIT